MILLLAFSCSEKDPSPSISKEYKTASPKITVLSDLPDSSKPVKILLKKPVKRIKAGRPIIHSFLDSATHMLMPPEEQAAGFFTNYTSDDGLALDGVNYSAVDKDGNLWFGTDGGGVSRYDGRSFTNYNNQHGLLNNQVVGVTQDGNGDLWFLTGLGLSRFDGKSFSNYTKGDALANIRITSIFGDKSGKLWIGTAGGGLSLFDGKKFVSLTTAHGLADNNVTAIAEDKSGNLWIGTKNGISHYDRTRFKSYTPPQLRNQIITSIAEDNEDNIWIGTLSGLFRYDARGFRGDSGTVKFPTKDITCITKDQAGNLWIGTHRDGVIRHDGRTFTRFTTTNGLPTNDVYSISEDKSGNLWFVTGGGITRYGGKSFMNYTEARVLGDHFIFGMTEDKAGDIWFGNYGAGVVRYDGKSFSTYTVSQGLVNHYAKPRIKDKKGNIWIATAGGVSCFDGQSFTNYTQADGLSSNAITCIAETRNGDLWFGTHSGVSRFDGNSFINYSEVHGLQSNLIMCITEDAQGGLWLGTDKGLTRFDGSRFISYSTANGLPHNHLYSSAMDRSGNLWFGTLGGGVSRFDGKSFMNFTVAQGLPDNNVPAIVADSAGKIIFGTNAGLGVLIHFNRYPSTEKEPLTLPAQNDLTNDDLKNYTPQFEIYNVTAGYPIRDLCTQTMIEDNKGNIWMGIGEVKTRLVRFDYSSVHKNKEPPVPVLHNVKINNENVCWQDLLTQFPGKDSGTSGPDPHITEEATTFGFILPEEDRDSMRSKFKGIKFDSIRRFYPIPENLVLLYRHNNITIDFGCIELNSPNLVRYQYILEGYDKDWSPVTEKTSASFGNISEGTYTFRLKARSPEGIWSEPVSYSFKVLPPWWRTWWAQLAYILSFVVIARMFAWYRSRRLKSENQLLEEKVIMRTNELKKSLEERYMLSKKIESQQALLNERLRISRELHDDIGSTLGSISIYSEIAKNRSEKNANATEVLSKIGVASRDLIDKMSDIVWSLNPNNDNFEQLQNRMDAFATMILSPRNIRYDLNTDEELKKTQLTSEQSKNIFLIFKEALYNTVKYADCNKVCITLALQKNDLIMIIQDDGKGFEAFNLTSNDISAGTYIGGNGIKNMHARAEDLKAILSVDSKINEGTTVQLIVNL